MGVVNSKYFISAWNEVIQSNGHNFWTMCRMALKKKPKWREFYWLSFALNFSFVGAKTRILWPFHCCQTKIFFHKKTGIGKSRGIGATNQHEIVTWWSWYFSVQYISKVVQYSCLHFPHFGSSCPKKLQHLLWDVFLLTKNNGQFQKVDCCLQRTPFRFRKNHCS